MRNQFDNYEKKIIEKLDREAEEIERRIEENPEVAEYEADEELDRKVYAGVEAYEAAVAKKDGSGADGAIRAKDTEVSDLAGLNEEDMEALRLGRELQERRRKKERRKKLGKKARRFAGGWKRLAAAAVVLVLVVGVGVDSIGGPNRVVEMIGLAIGGREISKINSSSDDVKITEKDAEKEAYQQIKDELGIDPVRIICSAGGVIFKDYEVDSDIRTVQLLYEYKGGNVFYLIDASYTKETWGFDIEDTKIDEYPYVKGKLNAKVAEYQLPDNKDRKYCAEFEYKGIYYQLVGIMKWEKFEEILKNLHFPG